MKGGERMETMTRILIWVLEIGGAALIVLNALLWLRGASRGQATARSFMALILTFIFFIVVILRKGDFDESTIRWLSIVYGGVMAFYITARMVEHREEIKAGKG
jgi:hypothetical protein